MKHKINNNINLKKNCDLDDFHNNGHTFLDK